MADGAIRRPAIQLRDFQIVALGLVGAAALAPAPMPYLCVVIPGLLPLYLWLTAGAPGLPTLPLTAALSIIYYAVPVLRGEMSGQDPEQVLYATASVGCFLISATIPYWLLLQPARRRQFRGSFEDTGRSRTAELAFISLAVGIAFYVLTYADWLDWLGNYDGLFRAMTLSFGSIGCYLVGSARAQNQLHGERWVAALLCLGMITALSINGLLLVGAAVCLLGAILGYVVTARRLPWITLAIAFGIISIFQAGKAEIRAERADTGSAVSLTELPGTIFEWFTDGIDVLWTGAQQTDALERATLLWIVLRVENSTPDFVPYLGGETYELLPHIILPRFIEPEKVRSQAGLNLLAVRYGLQSLDATDRTTIGFGPVAEAYANFGFTGVLVVGAVFGALCGAITWFGAGGSAISPRMLMSIAATSALLNVEADLSFLLVTMAQAMGGVLVAVTAVAPVIRLFAPARSGVPLPATRRADAFNDQSAE